MMNRLAFLFFFLAVAGFLQAQPVCGLDEATRKQISDRVQARVEAFERDGYPSSRGGTIYCPITFHLVSNAEGLGAARETDILRTLCLINDAFLSTGIQFYLKRFNYFSNDKAYQSPSGTLGQLKLKNEKFDDSINIYICNTANSDNQLDGVTLGYYLEGNNYEYDYIVIRKASFLPSEFETPTHELGHFFSLPHTFNGWECATDPNELQCMPGIAPATSSCGAVATERANGSNCTTAGDFICDTQADFNFGFGCTDNNGGTSCPNSYNPLINDPLNTELPNFASPYNFMSYFIGCSSYIFSDIQGDLMNDNANSAPRNYCTPGITPNTGIITSSVVLLEPANNAVLAYNQVLFTWNAVENATDYIVEIDKSSSFNINPKRYFTNSNGLMLNNAFLPNTTNYNWRVLAFNESGSCASVPTVARKFSTNNTVNAQDLNNFANWTIAPNPVKAGTDLLLTVDAPRAFEGNLQLFSVVGQMVNNQKVNFVPGRNIQTINTTVLPKGVYIVALTSELGTISQRVIVAE